MGDMNSVYFTPWEQRANMLEKTGKLYETAHLLDCVAPGDLVAVKLHVGELGNPNYVRPFFVKQVLDMVSAKGGRPFLTDTTTYYLVQRCDGVNHMETAVTHGFGFSPFISADGLKGENGISVSSPDPVLDCVEVAGAIHQADAMIVISHFKGHPLAGFGGAVKNLGMGCVTKRTKLAQHRLVGLEIDPDQCQGCGACSDACRFGYPHVVDDKVVIDHEGCMRCPVCAGVCPEGAIRLVGKKELGKGVAVAAAGVMSCFPRKKTTFINFATAISTFCDCVPFSGELVSPDLGIFAGSSPLMVDMACLERIDTARLNRMHDTDCHEQIRTLAGLWDLSGEEPVVQEV